MTPRLNTGHGLPAGLSTEALAEVEALAKAGATRLNTGHGLPAEALAKAGSTRFNTVGFGCFRGSCFSLAR